MARGSGKFKTKRGGGRSFSRNLQLDENGTAVAVDKWAAREKDIDEEESDDEEEQEEEDDDDDDDDDDADLASKPGQPEMSRAERKAAKKAVDQKKKGVADDEDEDDEDADLINPNHSSAKTKKLSELNAPQPLTRREREQKEKQEAKERYWKAHLAGKTDQAKADLARLSQIRKEREEAQAKRKAEAEAKAASVEAKASSQGRRR
ncbi:casein kinase substrate phosphoprotein PP28-domain-containing protein [Gautieria morchelliformis]|nr:casein kinase substrate phosphoprotein PP28-domain-containing protein [Gautieria morchelliformis]